MLSVSCGTRFAGLNRFGNEPHPAHKGSFKFGAFRSRGVCLAAPPTISFMQQELENAYIVLSEPKHDHDRKGWSLVESRRGQPCCICCLV